MSTRESVRTEACNQATRVILSTFRANGLFISSGDLLAAEVGLTSARWQVLGAIALAGRPLTVPQIARRMGLTRQSVHASVRRLVGDGLLALERNRDHKRSQLVHLTEDGMERYHVMERRQTVWVNRLAHRLSPSDLETTARILDELSDRLQTDHGEGHAAKGGSR